MHDVTMDGVLVKIISPCHPSPRYRYIAVATFSNGEERVAAEAVAGAAARGEAAAVADRHGGGGARGVCRLGACLPPPS